MTEEKLKKLNAIFSGYGKKLLKKIIVKYDLELYKPLPFSKDTEVNSVIRSLALGWLATRKIEKELKRVQKKDRKGKELRGCKPPKGL